MPHIRHEPKTRERRPEFEGKDLPDHIKSVAWCGADIDMEFFFMDASHALYTIESGSAIDVCADCRRAILDAIEDSFDEAKWS